MLEYAKKIWHGLIASLALLLVIASVALYAVAYYLIRDESQQTVVISIASAILAGGVFAALLKSFQFIGVFRDAIADVMYRDPRFLERLDLPELMRSIISATIAQRFPQLASAMSRAVFGDYLTFAKDYYYKDMHRRITITSYDPTTDVIEFKEEFRLTIRADPNQPLLYTFALKGDHPSSIQGIPCQVTGLVVNNVSYLTSVTSATSSGIYKLGYEIRLSGKDTYEVTRMMHRKHVLASDPFVKAVSTRFLDGGELIVDNQTPTKIDHRLIAIGIEDSRLVKDLGMSGELHRWKLEGLIFPRQGYILIFIKKP